MLSHVEKGKTVRENEKREVGCTLEKCDVGKL